MLRSSEGGGNDFMGSVIINKLAAYLCQIPANRCIATHVAAQIWFILWLSENGCIETLQEAGRKEGEGGGGGFITCRAGQVGKHNVRSLSHHARGHPAHLRGKTQSSVLKEEGHALGNFITPAFERCKQHISKCLSSDWLKRKEEWSTTHKQK